MTDRVIVDAGPALNFFSINKERVLLDAIGQIAAPETVADEVRRKARQHARFQVAEAVWAKLEKTTWLEILSDAVTPQLAAAVERITSVQRRDAQSDEHPHGAGARRRSQIRSGPQRDAPDLRSTPSM
jgi:hypothetical protein